MLPAGLGQGNKPRNKSRPRVRRRSKQAGGVENRGAPRDDSKKRRGVRWSDAGEGRFQQLGDCEGIVACMGVDCREEAMAASERYYAIDCGAAMTIIACRSG